MNLLNSINSITRNKCFYLNFPEKNPLDLVIILQYNHDFCIIQKFVYIMALSYKLFNHISNNEMARKFIKVALKLFLKGLFCLPHKRMRFVWKSSIMST